MDEINNLSAGQLQTEDLIDTEENPEEIIRAMDNDETTGDGLRNRRTAFYRNSSNQTTIEGEFIIFYFKILKPFTPYQNINSIANWIDVLIK